MNEAIKKFNLSQLPGDQEICSLLASQIEDMLPEASGKIWHSFPVWFINNNPIVGYSKQKAGWRLMFWSGADFNEPQLAVVGKKFKDASIFYTDVNEINTADLQRWLEKSKTIQWDYENIVKRKGELVRRC
ncbi:MAG: hypothetical protein RLY16_1221 [Bacteroidota bacterium]